jgi:hypothetical protein
MAGLDDDIDEDEDEDEDEEDLCTTGESHWWIYERDEGGDSSVPGGTFDASVWVCTECGKVSGEDPYE